MATEAALIPILRLIFMVIAFLVLWGESFLSR
jgi:hypothetical protein